MWEELNWFGTVKEAAISREILQLLHERDILLVRLSRLTCASHAHRITNKRPILRGTEAAGGTATPAAQCQVMSWWRAVGGLGEVGDGV